MTMREQGRSKTGIALLSHVQLAPMSAPGLTGERQEHLDVIIAFAGAGQRRRLFRILDITVKWANCPQDHNCFHPMPFIRQSQPHIVLKVDAQALQSLRFNDGAARTSQLCLSKLIAKISHTFGVAQLGSSLPLINRIQFPTKQRSVPQHAAASSHE